MASESKPATARGLALMFVVILVGMFLYSGVIGPGVGGCAARIGSGLRLSLDLREGWLISHDLALTNTTGEELTEVNLKVRVVGEDGSPVVDRYWAHWPLGAKQVINVPVSNVTNLQRVEVTGSADQGRIDQTFEVNH
jgi:hypothetical protein